MASKNIKGITIRIGGDTTELSKALKDVNGIVAKSNSELKSLNQALKLDPKNTELLSQKQEVLRNNIKATTERLNTLKEAQRQIGSYNSLTDEQKESYRALSVEIGKSENALKSLENEYKNFGSVASQQLKAVGEDLKKTGDKITSVGSGMTKSVTAPIAGVMALGVTYNAQMEKYQTALTTLTGSTEKANKIIEQIKSDAAKTPFDVAGLTQANQLLLSTGLGADESRETILALGNAIAATGGGDDELSRMAVNLQQIKNVGQATALDIKQFAYAGIDVYGMLADYLGITKEEASEMTVTWDDLNGALINASKEGGKYYQAMDKQSETFNGKLSNLKDSLGVLTSELATALMPILDKLITFVTGLMEKFNNLSPQMQNIISTILLVVAAIGPVVLIVGKIITLVGTISSVISAIIPVISAVVTAIGWPVAAIAAVIAVIVLLWNKCEWFREGVKAILEFIWNAIKERINMVIETFKTLVAFVSSLVTLFSNVVSAIINAITQLPTKAKEVVTNIKNAFVNFIKNTNWGELGMNIVKGICEGFLKIGSYIADKVREVKNQIVSKFKSIFGIHSPSTLMRDTIGLNITAGIGEGIEEGVPKALKDVDAAMKELNAGIEASVNPTINPSMTYESNYQLMAQAMKEALQDMTIELDDENVGKFVIKTVTEEVYS